MLLRERQDYLLNRYCERKESAQELAKGSVLVMCCRCVQSFVGASLLAIRPPDGMAYGTSIASKLAPTGLHSCRYQRSQHVTGT